MTYYDAEIEYLEGTGVQYIDTEIIPTLQYSFECGFYYVSYDSVTDASATLFGCQSTWITESFTLLVTPSKTGLYNCWGNKYTMIERSANTTYWNTLIGVWHTLEFKNKETYIDGIKKLSAVASGTSGEPTLSIHLFNCQRNGNPTFGKGSIKRISYAKIFNENNNLILDLIPVRIGSVGYMYDKVSDTLFGNSGTGSFTLGPDVKVTAPIVGKPKVSSIRRQMIQLMPRIPKPLNYIQDGLVFHLDGIDKGSNLNAWIDLKGGIVFSPTGNVMFNNDNIAINENNTYLQANATLGNSTNNTVEVCYYTTKSTFFVFGEKNGNNYPVYYNSAGRMTFMQANSTYKTHTAQYNTVSLNLDRCIANGNNISKDGSTDWWTASSRVGTIRIGKGANGGASSNFFTGKIYSIRIYNRRLTEEEMRHNQSVDNKRFNLGLDLT